MTNAKMPRYFCSCACSDAIARRSVSDVYTEWRDATHHPDIVSRPERFAMARNAGFERDLVLARGRGSQLQRQGEIDIPLSARLDDMFANYSLDFISKAAPSSTTANGTAANNGSSKPWLLYHATRGCHFDNYPGNWTGASPAAFPFTDVRDRRAHRPHALRSMLRI